MRQLCFFLAILLTSCLGYAKPISEQDAIRIAKNFFSQNSPHRMKSQSATVSNFNLIYTCSEKKTTTRSDSSDKAYYYIINVNKDDGFIIVSGDTRAKEILAYSDKKGFHPENLPENCAFWLQGYKEQLSRLMSSPEEITSPIAVFYPKTVIEPLIQTLWDQGNPYNLDCPMDQTVKPSQRSVTGCTATAIAQIMNYHKWPDRPTGTITYRNNKLETDRTMNFDQMPAFDWEHMKAIYDQTSTQEEKEAVANLMVCVGHGIKMDYSSSASGANLANTTLALRDFFKYENLHYYERNFISDANEWIKILLDELTAQRPILYSGYNDKVGHAFVCDGYDGDGMFHFNWGWTGLSDGYYSVDNLDPGSQGIGGSENSYTFSQHIIARIQHPDASRPSEPQKSIPVITTLTTSGPIGEKGELAYAYDNPMQVSIKSNYYVGFYLNNLSLNDLHLKTKIGIIQEDGSIITISEEVGMTVKTFASLWKNLLIKLPENLGKGDYKVAGFYKTDGENEWNILKTNIINPNTYQMKLTDDSVRFEKIKPQLEISMNGSFAPGIIYKNGRKEWSFSVQNTGSVRLSSRIGLRLSGENLSNDIFYTDIFFAEPEKIVQINLTETIDVPIGNYTLTPIYLSNNSLSSTISEEHVVDLQGGIPVAIITKPSIYIEPVEKYLLDKQTGSLEISLTQPSKTPWQGRLYGEIYKGTGDGKTTTNIRLYSENTTMSKPWETRDIKLQGSIDLSTGDDYSVLLYIDDGNNSILGSSLLSIIDSSTSIASDIISDLEIEITPSKEIVITASKPLFKASLVNLSGNVLSNSQLNGANKGTLQVGSLPSGIYLVKIQTQNSTEIRKVIIK